MIRSELVQKIASENSDLRLDEVERIVDTFFDSIVAQLAEGGRVELRGFGAFSTRSRESRTGRNPRTGASVDVKAKWCRFKPGKEMREPRWNDVIARLSVIPAKAGISTWRRNATVRSRPSPG